MSGIEEKITENEKQILKEGDFAREKDGSVLLPDLGEIQSECKSYFLMAGHVQWELLEIVKLYYPKKQFRKWFDSLNAILAEDASASDNFKLFLEHFLPALRFIRNCRNSVEHPKENEFLSVTDFSVNAKCQLITPTIELVHPSTPQPATSATHLMKETTSILITIVEQIIVYLCDLHIKGDSGFKPKLVEMPSEQRKYEHSKYGYVIEINGKYVPVG